MNGGNPVIFNLIKLLVSLLLLPLRLIWWLFAGSLSGLFFGDRNKGFCWKRCLAKLSVVFALIAGAYAIYNKVRQLFDILDDDFDFDYDPEEDYDAEDYIEDEDNEDIYGIKEADTVFGAEADDEESEEECDCDCDGECNCDCDCHHEEQSHEKKRKPYVVQYGLFNFAYAPSKNYYADEIEFEFDDEEN